MGVQNALVTELSVAGSAPPTSPTSRRAGLARLASVVGSGQCPHTKLEDPFEYERGKLATYRVDGNQILKTIDGTHWRVLFTYGDTGRLRQIMTLLNDAAIGHSDWLRKELSGEPTIVSACDDCPLFGRPDSKCRHPAVDGRVVAYVEAMRPDWCPLVQQPLYLKARPS